MMRRTAFKCFVVAGIVVAAACVVVVVCYFFISVSKIDFVPLGFNSENWRATRSEISHSSIRLRMVDDFLKTQQPIGKSREEVVGMLGEPDDTPYFSDYDMVYHLGLERNDFIAIDSEWLVMRVDDKDIVTEARLIRD